MTALRKSSVLVGWIAIATLVSTEAALAHAATEGVSGFTGGMLHPVLVPTHALAVVGLGLFIGRMSNLLSSLCLFAAALAAGLFAIAMGTGETPAEIILLACTVVAGGLVASAWHPPYAIAAVLIGGVAIALGLDSPPQAVTIAEGNAILVGTQIGGCITTTLVAVVRKLATAQALRLGARIIGSWIAASAMLILATAFARV